MYQLYFRDAAAKVFWRLDRETRTRLTRALDALCIDPFHTANVKRLHGEFDGCFRLRIGDWRIVYHVELATRCVVIHGIASRGDIYR